MIIIGNGKVVTRDESNNYYENGAVVIENGLIKKVGEFEKIKSEYSGYDFIDAKGKLIMPGFINTHMHIYSAFARGMSLDGPVSYNFGEILQNLWWRLDKGLTLEDTKYSAYTTLIDCIKNGVTTVFDHHASPNHVKNSLFTIADVAKELGIRTNLSYEVSDRDNKIDESIKENIEFIKYTNKEKSDMVKGMFGMHASFTLSDETLYKCASQMEGLDTGYHIHTAEGIEDLKSCLKNHGKRVVERLFDFNLLNDKTIAVHCIHVNEREMELLKETKTIVVHNPESNMGNAVGCSPVIKMFDRQIELGLGTDGYTSDMMESYKVGNLIHKHHLCDNNAAWTEIPTMLFKNNKEIASRFLSTQTGMLKNDCLADVIVVDYDPLTPMNQNNINSHLLFGINGRNVTHTIINGKVLMKDRELTCCDEKEIMSKSRELAQNLWKRV